MGLAHECILYPTDALQASAPTFKITLVYFQGPRKLFQLGVMCISSWGQKGATASIRQIKSVEAPVCSRSATIFIKQSTEH